MSRLPILQAKEVVRILKRVGFLEDRQKGSHLILIQPQTGARTVVPMHPGKTLKRSLLFSILKDARITVKEFLEMM